MIELVSVRPNHQSAAYSNHGLRNVPDGVQCAEINANYAGALYQDVLTVPGSTMYWRLYHDARSRGWGQDISGYDTMYVIIAPVEKVKDIKTQDQLEEVRKNHAAYNATIKEVKTHTSEGWKEWSNVGDGGYAVPEGQYLTRYFFMSGPTASNKDTSVGNHIDDVSFSTKMPGPKDDEATLTIQKTIEGLSGEELVQAKANLTFKVTIDGEETEVKINNWNDNVGTWQKTVKIPVNTTTGVTYTVSEVLESAKIDGYTVTSVITTEGTESGTLFGKDEKQVEFQNTYVLDKIPGSLSITKTVVRTDGNEITTDRDFTFELTSDPALKGEYTAEITNGVENTPAEVTFTNGVANITLKHGQTITINGIPQDTRITVTESNTDGYAVSWDNGGVSHTNATTVTIPRGANAAITCTNTTGAVLPRTGGAGTAHIMSVGAALTLAAGALLLLKRRKEASGAN